MKISFLSQIQAVLTVGLVEPLRRPGFGGGLFRVLVEKIVLRPDHLQVGVIRIVVLSGGDNPFPSDGPPAVHR